MDRPIIITKKQAIAVMESNLKRLKDCSDSDTFLLLSHDLVTNQFLGRTRMNGINGRGMINKSKTFILNEDKDEFAMSILSIYTEKQGDIYNILPIGKKHDMILIQQLE